MVTKRTKVSLRHWKNANIALQQSLRAGDMDGARRYAHTLLTYLSEMGLINDNDRLGNSGNLSDSHIGSISKEG
jgi:hypothetical protein